MPKGPSPPTGRQARGGQTDVVVVVVVPVDADIEPALAEVADIDTVAARSDRGSPNIGLLEEPRATHLVEGRDEPAHLASVWNLLFLREKPRLLVPVLIERVRNGLLADGEPLGLGLVAVAEGVTFIPPASLRVEVF